VSSDLLPEMQVRSRPSAPAPPCPEENLYKEFVIERLLSHGVDDDGDVVMRIRWCDFGSADDAWEPVTCSAARTNVVLQIVMSTITVA
jgi:hypothetical protein